MLRHRDGLRAKSKGLKQFGSLRLGELQAEAMHERVSPYFGNDVASLHLGPGHESGRRFPSPILSNLPILEDMHGHQERNDP